MRDRIWEWTFGMLLAVGLCVFVYVLAGALKHPNTSCGRFYGDDARSTWIGTCAEHRSYEACTQDADRLGCR